MWSHTWSWPGVRRKELWIVPSPSSTAPAYASVPDGENCGGKVAPIQNENMSNEFPLAEVAFGGSDKSGAHVLQSTVETRSASRHDGNRSARLQMPNLPPLPQ